jgi:hypothetical protein
VAAGRQLCPVSVASGESAAAATYTYGSTPFNFTFDEGVERRGKILAARRHVLLSLSGNARRQEDKEGWESGSRRAPAWFDERLSLSSVRRLNGSLVLRQLITKPAETVGVARSSTKPAAGRARIALHVKATARAPTTL